MSADIDFADFYDRQQKRLDESEFPAGGIYTGVNPPFTPQPGTASLKEADDQEFGLMGLRTILSNALKRLSQLNPPHLSSQLTRYAVAALSEVENELTNDAIAALRDNLRKPATELSRKTARAIDEAGGIPKTIEGLAEFTRDGMFLLDAVLLDHLKTIGQNGVDLASEGRLRAQERWDNFQETISEPYEPESDYEIRPGRARSDVNLVTFEQGPGPVDASLRRFFRLWQPAARALPNTLELNPDLSPMVVEFQHTHETRRDIVKKGEIREYNHPGTVRALCSAEIRGKRVAKQIDGPDPKEFTVSPWRSEGPGMDDHISILRSFHLLTGALWKDQVRNNWKRHRNSQPVQMTGVRYGDNQDAFAKIDKTAGAFPTKGRLQSPSDEGTQPVEVDDANDLEIDDERFANAPGVLRMIPQQWGVAQDADSPDPSTTQLPLGITPEREGASVAFRIFADSQVQLKPTAAKIVVGLHLLSPQTGGLGSVELGELTEWINQGKSRPGQKRNRRKVRNNLIAARSLGVPPNLDGTGHNIQMFEVHPPDGLDKGDEVVFGHTRLFQEFLHRIENGDGPFGQLRGEFVLNADGFMRISGNDSDAARMYLTLCATWNDHGWDPDRLPFRHIDKLARRSNQLSEQARRALDEGTRDREQLRQGRSQTKKAIEKLIDKYELVGDLAVTGPEGNRKLKVLPNDKHRQAWEYLRDNPDRRLELDDS